MRRSFISSLILFLLLTIPVAVRADLVTVTFNPASLIGSPGDTLTVEGTLLATLTGSPYEQAGVSITGAGLTLAGFPVSASDLTDFILNSPLVMLNGESATFDFFTLAIPGGLPHGNYGGTFIVQGGIDGSAQDTLGTTDFSVQVVPEPGSWLLLISGMLGLAGISRRRKQE